MVGLRSRWDHPIQFSIIAFFLTAIASQLCGQTAEAPRNQVSIAEIIPASTRVFINIHDLNGLHQVLRRAKAFEIVNALRSGRSDSTQDKRSNIDSFLKVLADSASPIPLDDLKGCEIGLVLDSPRDLINPVWVIRARDEETVRRWFPQHGPQVSEGGGANIFRTDDGRFVCIRGRVVAIAPRASDWMQLGNVLRALTGADLQTIDKLASYRESMAYLPSRALATLYLTLGPTDAADVSAQHLAVGLYAKDHTVDLAFHGSLWRTVGAGAVSPAAMERFLQLPQTTLAAYLTTLDWESVSKRQSQGTPGILVRYVRLIKELSQAGMEAEYAAPRLGRHLIAAWGQDFSPRGTTPQLAILIDTPEAVRVAESTTRVATSLTRILSTLELRNVAEELPIEKSVHLGIPVWSVPLRAYAHKSRFAWVKALGNLTPSWAANGDWFVVTLTTEHMHQLLDAQIGFLSVLGNDRDARTLRDVPPGNASVAFLHGAMASTTLHFWERSLGELSAAGALPKLLAPGDPAAQNNQSLGIEIGDEDTLGLIEVTGVASSTPASGRLKPGDRIVGIDGRLLEMVSPEDDLRAWWEQASPGSSHSIRVLRGEELVELEVKRRPDQAALANLFSEPLNILRELTRISESIPAATLQVHDSSDRHFSALLRLRLEAVEQ